MLDVNNKINGFMVVRKPEFNLLFNDETVVRKPITINGKYIYYGGIDRAPWHEFGNELFTNNLMLEIQQSFKNLEDQNWDFTGLFLGKDLDTSIKLLNYANSVNPKNELMAIYSENLVEYKGEYIFDEARIEWEGYDIVSIGQWSLILDGVFWKPEHFTKWIPFLNEHGLFSSDDIFEEFVKDYITLSAIDENRLDSLGSKKGTGGVFGEAVVRVGTVII